MPVGSLILRGRNLNVYGSGKIVGNKVEMGLRFKGGSRENRNRKVEGHSVFRAGPLGWVPKSNLAVSKP